MTSPLNIATPGVGEEELVVTPTATDKVNARTKYRCFTVNYVQLLCFTNIQYAFKLR